MQCIVHTRHVAHSPTRWSRAPLKRLSRRPPSQHVNLEPEGIPFPFSRGCSFVRVNERGEITYARDIVEPVAKPGRAAVGVIGLLGPLMRKVKGCCSHGVLGTAAAPSARN